ncbi:MAG TPA: hypothetical protein VKV37_09455 [Ktedonobacteraceae bacterium]|nr:hypothetical protein [Ktedonobacteraceae bacterium]
MKKYQEPLICVQATPNEVIALNAAIGRHTRYFWREQEVNRLLAQFQRRLIENLPTVPLNTASPTQGGR